MTIRMAYSYPEQLQRRGDGWERVPNHPTRPARETDLSTWMEEIPIENCDPATMRDAAISMTRQEFGRLTDRA